jgi:hypothetical protein
MKYLGKLLLLSILILVGMSLMGVPTDQTDLQKWLWTPLGGAMLMLAGRLFPWVAK